MLLEDCTKKVDNNQWQLKVDLEENAKAIFLFCNIYNALLILFYFTEKASPYRCSSIYHTFGETQFLITRLQLF